MPGFYINGTGGAANGPSNTQEVRRAHRWLFETIGNALTSSCLLLLKEASRPHPTIEEPEMHHNQEQVYFAGKHKWDSVKMSWYDGEQPTDVSSEIWGWLNKVIDIPNATAFLPSEYKMDATLQMLQADGKHNEQWNLYGCWPQDVNWNTLDYTSTELQLIEVTMRYDRAVREDSFGV